MLAFHGAGGTGTGMQDQTGLSALGDQRGFLIAYPQGLAQPGAGGRKGWDASGPRDPQAHGIDEGLFVSNVLTAVQAKYCVDPSRITAAGFSNGAGLVGYLACVLAGRISAFAAVEAEFFQIPGGCHPVHPASILDVHAVTDPVAPYAGVPARGSPDYYAPAIPDWLQAWALRDGCRLGPRVFLRSPTAAGERWGGCDDGVTVAAYRLTEGGHSWPRTLGGVAGTQAIADFIATHPLRAPARPWTPHPSTPVPALTVPGIAVSSLREYRLPTRAAEPFDIARGPGGNIWFTEFNADKIGRISPLGAVAEFRVPTPGAEPYQITAGPDGAMWFTEYNTTRIGRVSPGGRVTEVTTPRGSGGGLGITAGRGGTIQVADPAGYVDRITPAGTVSRTSLHPHSGFPFAIASGTAGSTWVTESGGFFEHGQALVHVSTSARLRTFTATNPASNIDALTAGPHGTLWFTDYGTSQIGARAPDGRLRLFTDPSPYRGLNDITSGPDGAMWFTEQAGLIGRVTSAGIFCQFALPSPGSGPDGITAGPGQTVWVAETGADAIARIALPPP